MEEARQAWPADAERVEQLRAEATAALGPVRGGHLLGAELARRGAVAERLADGRVGDAAAVRVGTLDGIIVGYGTVRVDDLAGERLGVVEELYVEPAARGVGVGEAIMESMTQWCVASGCSGVDGVALPGDRTAKGFFERHGFTARLLVMHRRLAPATPPEG